MGTPLELGFLSFSVAFTSISFIFLLYQCIINFTKLRLACLLSTFTIIIISISNFYWDQDPTKLFIPRSVYWILFAFIRATYTTIIVVCMLDMGRKFYEKYRWNTTLFKATVLHLIIFDCINIADAVLILIHLSDTSNLPLFIGQLIVGVITILSSFLYSFLPVISLRICFNNRQQSSIIKRKRMNNISAQSAAVGAWYMSITGILSICYLILYLVTFAFTDKLSYSAIGNSFDSLIRTGISLAVALPPPTKLIQFMKSKIIISYDVPHDSNDIRESCKVLKVDDQEFEESA
ncbi:uncharacterized protein OCT59_022472 [Rhizophagus irregularis]|uniref:Uncharacterized protein n=5 Tax=Rhizophagus irregularis TaxID=588596 RepID=A0A916ECZ5_9GLOM|nr:hypothetical protein GLOIN_2v1779462 [Rhizophagus irregularis DAOM 181602=DAOM 197198]EXX64098.1 hypothetical protein RirG_146030 [Rhizophagus irregularis DAOM 197198w]UZO28970.1 hypothetical protein OCT59_022472 [Rhizophagus irregularis]POG67462.1 hypothetical protein GLOIN_2v1779462 [Rhizophagus irregularis DAOM 181602=DAOM 197198]CAB4386137.1 unnamed protein product [Rhizophagus irregularis]CAB4486363.1 unnamed protein product [Rhizophagus irregularis]|eukprot:XP_025174328.1 hypothetical protein GLOIN_2v1779462 [Rhizophagus irregularis DAOM 181602=DAOM 197198]